MESGEHMVTLSQQLKLLADGFRKRYGKTETLTLADMTKLVTPPKFYSGIDLLGGTPLKHNDQDNKPFQFKVKSIPPVMKVPLTLAITFCDDGLLMWGNYLQVNLTSGLPLKLTTNEFADMGNKKTATFHFTVPANTAFGNNIFTIGTNDTGYGMGFSTIQSITATYVGGGN